MRRDITVLLSLIALLTFFSFTFGAKQHSFKGWKKYENADERWMMLRFFMKMFSIRPDEAEQPGIYCAGCTMVTALIEQLSQINNGDTEKVLDVICTWFPLPLSTECEALVLAYGPTIIKLIDEEQTPDVICQELTFCTNPQCVLFPPPISKPKYPVYIKSTRIPERPRVPNWCWPWECISDHLPILDADQDKFSTMFTLRGYAWRGADCNEDDATIYPGRKTPNSNPNIDHNCNGIFGKDPNTGKTYEDLYCSDVTQYGTILLGDSAGAHFTIPRSWINSTEMNEHVYLNVLDIAENEIDWPDMSAATGFQNSTWIGRPDGPVDSGYLSGRRRNLCSHRDYQNCGVDGARSGAMADNIVHSIARNQTTDNPVFATYALIGNDVCNSRLWDRGTSPQEFYANVMSALTTLDTKLPKGSHVIFIGLIDGRILYDTMHNLIHPIGSLNNDVTYSKFYDWFNCLAISPCSGWMSSNSSLRNFTSQNAAELNGVYQDIVLNTTFKNFDMHYYDCPMPEVVNMWNKMGGQTSDLIAKVDGFHPTQIADYLTVEVMNNKYAKDNLLPPINPNNDAIAKQFGDQGGYAPVTAKSKWPN